MTFFKFAELNKKMAKTFSLIEIIKNEKGLSSAYMLIWVATMILFLSLFLGGSAIFSAKHSLQRACDIAAKEAAKEIDVDYAIETGETQYLAEDIETAIASSLTLNLPDELTLENTSYYLTTDNLILTVSVTMDPLFAIYKTEGPLLNLSVNSEARIKPLSP
mgnify:CR=1 FL=1